MRKKLSLIAALIAFFAMTAVTFAANTAKITVTSEPITQKAVCDKSGAISFSFDHNTTFVSGDIITGDLPLNVTLCKNIDFIIGLENGTDDPQPYSGTQAFTGGLYAGTDTTFGSGDAANGVIPHNGLLPDIGTDNLGPVTGNGWLTAKGGGVVFWVRGTVGSQRVTITVLSDSNRSGIDRVESYCLAPETDPLYTNTTTGLPPSTTFNALDPSDVNSKLVINILDQKVYPTSDSALFTDRDKNIAGPNSSYYLRVVPAENTICINVSSPLLPDSYEYVNMSFDSKGDKYTWIPSNPQVAHVVRPKEINLVSCGKQECGYIPTPIPGSQGNAAICYPINNEAGTGIGQDYLSYARITDGYCEGTPQTDSKPGTPGTHRNNRLILQTASNQPFDTGLYQVQLEILVSTTKSLKDRKTGDQGAYFAGPIAWAATSTLTAACSATSAPVDTIYYNANDDYNSPGSLYQLDATGTVNTSLTPLVGSTVSCTIPAVNRITKVRTVETAFFNGTQSNLFVDIPNIVWDQALLTEGEYLEVKVTLLKAPCGALMTDYLCIGERGCPQAINPDLCREYSRVYPFFGKSDNYSNILGITNNTSLPMTFTIILYEKDGDKFQGSMDVPANSINYTEVKNLPGATLLAGSTGSGTIGDAQSYAVVKTVTKATSTPFIGFIYLFDKTTVGKQSFSSTLDSDLGQGSIVNCP